MKRATIKDIAEQLGVNPSTVSRALKDHPDISLALRTEIKKVAEALHYRPNLMAIQLRRRSSRLIGLIVPDISMFFYPSVIRGMQEVLQAKGFNLIMLSSNESPELEIENIRICAENEVAGILVAVTRQSKIPENLKLLLDMDTPIVMFDKIQEGLPFDTVVLEDEAAAASAVTHLIKTGCTRIGGLFGDPNMLITQRRVKGFRRALEDHGHVFQERYVLFASDTLEAQTCAASLLQLDPAPDGIFAMTDEIILGTLSVISQSQKRIPEECSVICISDGLLPYGLHPKVSFLHHDGFELGKLSALHLLSLIESGALISEGYIGKQISIQTKLVQLATTRHINN